MHSIRVEEYRTWKPNGIENLLDHLRTHLEQILKYLGEEGLDDFVYDFERQPGEEIRDYEIQHIVETLQGSGCTSDSSD